MYRRDLALPCESLPLVALASQKSGKVPHFPCFWQTIERLIDQTSSTKVVTLSRSGRGRKSRALAISGYSFHPAAQDCLLSSIA
jgi:hypothetical protein